MLRTDASDYAVGAVLEQVREDDSHVPVPFLAGEQHRSWTAREEGTYAIICASHKWSRHIGLQRIVVCNAHQSLQSWHRQHIRSAARGTRCHEMLAKVDFSVVYVPRMEQPVPDCLRPCAYPAWKPWIDIFSNGGARGDSGGQA